MKYIPYFDTEFVDLKEKNPVNPLVQLSYVLPQSSLSLLPDNIQYKLIAKKSKWYNNNCEFQWAFCKYFWESHVIMKTIDISKLPK